MSAVAPTVRPPAGGVREAASAILPYTMSTPSDVGLSAAVVAIYGGTHTDAIPLNRVRNLEVTVSAAGHVSVNGPVGRDAAHQRADKLSARVELRADSQATISVLVSYETDEDVTHQVRRYVSLGTSAESWTFVALCASVE